MLREKLAQLLPADETGGFIIRTVAETATDAELRGDIEYLKKLWHGIRGRALTAPAPTLLYQDLSLAQRVLRDIAGESTGRSSSTRAKTSRSSRSSPPSTRPRCSRSSSTIPASGRFFDLHNVEEESSGRFAQVELKSGATWFSTDRGDDHDRRQHRRLRGTRSFDDTIFKTNLGPRR